MNVANVNGRYMCRRLDGCIEVVWKRINKDEGQSLNVEWRSALRWVIFSCTDSELCPSFDKVRTGGALGRQGVAFEIPRQDAR
jgi:hypothetical protein